MPLFNLKEKLVHASILPKQRNIPRLLCQAMSLYISICFTKEKSLSLTLFGKNTKLDFIFRPVTVKNNTFIPSKIINKISLHNFFTKKVFCFKQMISLTKGKLFNILLLPFQMHVWNDVLKKFYWSSSVKVERRYVITDW